MILVNDVRRQEAQHFFMRSIDHDAALEHGADHRFRKISGIEFGGEHEADAANGSDRRMLLLQIAQLFLEVVAQLCDVGEQLLTLERGKEFERHCASEWSTAKCCAVHT